MFYGKRVTLRAIEEADLPLLSRFDNDFETELASGGDPPMPRSKGRRVRWFDDSTERQGKDTVNFAIEADGQLIGHCGLFHFDLVAQNCELGIGIGLAEYRGKGYGREVIGLLLNWAFRYRNLHWVWLTTNESNVRAPQCYLACGFVEEGRQRQQVWTDGRY